MVRNCDCAQCVLILIYFVKNIFQLTVCIDNALIYYYQFTDSTNSTQIIKEAYEKRVHVNVYYTYLILYAVLFLFIVMYLITLISYFKSKKCYKTKNMTDENFMKMMCDIIVIKPIHFVLAATNVLLELITFQECLWRISYKLRIVLSLLCTLLFYAFLIINNGFIVYIYETTTVDTSYYRQFLTTKAYTTKKNNITIVTVSSEPTIIMYDHLIAIVSLILLVFLLAWEIFYFFYYSLYVPGSLKDIQCCQLACKSVKKIRTYFSDDRKTIFAPSFERFIRLAEKNTSNCILGTVCGSTNLEHVLKCHSELHIPTKACNPYYSCTCRSNYLVGFHQTSYDRVRGIALNGMKLGQEGMFGGGIYFARSLDQTFFKAVRNGVFIVALVNMGRMKVIDAAAPWTTLENLNQEGFDSIYAIAGNQLKRDEFVVYSTSRVVQFIICS